MRRLPVTFLLSVVVCSATAFAQAAPATQPSDGLELLRQVGRHYADAKSYYIRSTEETTNTSEYEHSLRKTALVAAEAPGNRSYFEGHGASGSALEVSDGKTVWTYRMDEHRYTAKTRVGGWNNQQGPVAMSELARMNAEQLRSGLANLAKDFKSAERLADQDLVVNGQKVVCHVVRVQSFDEKRIRAANQFARTTWIDAAHMTVLKVKESAHIYLTSGAARIPLEQERETIYNVTELDAPVQEALFVFTPPPDARRIADFPSAMDAFWGSLAGETIPSLKLKGADGTVIPIESFRGKPVLLDFWATWCAPCVASMPQLARIREETKAQGLVLLSVDQDEEAKSATDFLATKGYSWPDFHDGDGQIEKLMGSSGIPRTVLVDAKGTVVFDTAGLDEDRLRNEIAKLGPEYAGVAAKPKPCVAAK